MRELGFTRPTPIQQQAIPPAMDPAGHGGKSGRYDRLRDTAYDYAFLLWQLGVEKP